MSNEEVHLRGEVAFEKYIGPFTQFSPELKQKIKQAFLYAWTQGYWEGKNDEGQNWNKELRALIDNIMEDRQV